ncbi:hypothetical protein TKK_0016523 [Trichogramma kaykai]
MCNNAQCETNIYLQTLRVVLKGPYEQRIVRVLLDGGSHQTYIFKSVAREMKLEKIGEQTTMHNLFGGVKTEPRHHNKFKFSLMNLEKTYECKMTAYDEDVICAKLPNICPGPWISSLRSKNIVCSDVETNNEPFSVMIGADVIGKLYTGKMLQVQSGPTILGTKLGWTVSGKNDAKRNDDHEDAALTVFTMFNREAKVSDLWDLDLLGISDPITAQSKTEHQD